MLRGIIAFEWRYHTRRLTFAVAAVVFGFLGFVTSFTAFGPSGLHVNSPYSIANTIGLLSLVSVFALTLFCAQSLLRDTEHQMAEMIFTTAVTKGLYLFGRFAGALLAAMTTFVFALVGMVMGTFLAGHDPARLGPFDALDYLWPFAVLAVPDMLIVGSVLFAVAAFTRSALATYVGGVFIYILYFVAAMFTDSPLIATSSPPTPVGLALAALVDPFGLSAFFEQTHYWSLAERNGTRIVLDGAFLWNRLLWTGVALALLWVVYRGFAFRLPAGARGEAEDDTDRLPAAAPWRPAAAHAERPAAQWPAAQWRALASATRWEVRRALTPWPFVALLVMWVGMNTIEVVQFFHHAEFGTALHPTTGLVLGRIQEPLGLLGLLVVVYFSAEIVWRERAVRVHEIVDASPASSAVFLVSKAAALALLVGVLIGAAVAVSMTIQLLSGHHDLEPALYASIFYFTGLPLALVALMAVFVQTLVPNRYAGMLLTLVAVLVLHKGGLGGPEHPLLRYAAAAPVPYSAMNGFGPSAVSFHWFMAYWTLFAALLALLTCGVWRRGTDARLLPRLAALPHGWGRGARAAALTLGLLFVTAGASVFYQTNVLNAYETSEELYDWKADYERAYRRLEGVAQPSVVHMKTAVDLYPAERRYRMRGTYRLENRTGETVDEVWVAVRRDVELVALSLAGEPPAESDERFAVHTFVLDRPLAPGGRTRLEYELAVDRRAVAAVGVDHDVVENGSFLLSTLSQPSLGYHRGYELRDPAARRRRGLPPDSRPTTVEGARAAGLSSPNPARITSETTLSTPADQIALAPGRLLETRESDGRRTFRYAMETTARPFLAYVSARYAVERVRHGSIDVEVYYHPEHDANVGRIVEAARRSLDTFTRAFGPYPHPHLRIVEIPAHWTGFSGLAMPGVIYLVEDHAFLTDLGAGGRVDVVTKRVAHEVAHQWWGHQLVPAEEPGAGVLVETFARYSELLILKDLYGEAAVPPVLSFELDRYLLGRTYGEEVPLYQVRDQPWLFYSKGALVMMATHDLVGEEALNSALRGLLAEHADPEDPPTSLDFLDQLRRVTPEAHRALVEEWWKEVVLYDLRVASASYRLLPDGRYRLTVRVEAGRSAVRDGVEEPLEMDEALDVAVYSEHPNAATGADHVLYTGQHRVTGPTELAITVDERPAYVGLDPFLRRIDRNRVDNVQKVEEGALTQVNPGSQVFD